MACCCYIVFVFWYHHPLKVDWHVRFLFMLIALRLALNDSTPAYMFLSIWPQIAGNMFTPSSFSMKMVPLLQGLWQTIWKPKEHGMGHTAMMLPQCSGKGKTCTIQNQGAEYLCRVAAALRRVKKWPWSGGGICSEWTIGFVRNTCLIGVVFSPS